MALVTRVHSYPEDKPARASHANVNEITLYNEINGNLDWDNLKAALVNVAGGFIKLDPSGDVPLAQIPLDAIYNIDVSRELQHNSITIITTDGKVKHAVYG